MCEDYLTCDIAFNAVMPLSRASTRGRYSRIEGVTADAEDDGEVGGSGEVERGGEAGRWRGEARLARAAAVVDEAA